MTRGPLEADPVVFDDAEIRRRLGARIRELRDERGLTQEALAERAGEITYKHVGAIERGKTNASATSLVRIAYGLGVTVGELFSTITPDPVPRLPRRTINAVRESIHSLTTILDELGALPAPAESAPRYRLRRQRAGAPREKK